MRRAIALDGVPVAAPVPEPIQTTLDLPNVVARIDVTTSADGSTRYLIREANGRAYLSINNGPLEEVGGVNYVTASRDVIDVTTFGDAEKVYVQGLPDISGNLVGWWDDKDKWP